MGMKVKIIEKSLSKCKALAETLDGILVIHGEGTDSAFLREEGVADADGFVGTTGKETSPNVLLGLLAKNIGVKRAVITVNKPDYISLVEELGLDAAVNPLTMTANAILRFVRRGQIISTPRCCGRRRGHRVRRQRGLSLYRSLAARGGAAQGRPCRGRHSGGSIIIPDGKTTIEAGDRVVMITKPSSIPNVERYFGLR